MQYSPGERRIGIDFDNTIISYQQAFLEAARRQLLLPKGFIGTKQAIRNHIRSLPDGERRWMRLQGLVYGSGIGDAVLIDGVAEFLRRCRGRNYAVFIISHKTEFGHFDPSGVNLRLAALDWMQERGLFRDDGQGFAREDVYFEATRSAKLQRIAALGCTHFIDDLEEVLDDPAFPPQVVRVLFTDGVAPSRPLPCAICSTWQQIEAAVFDGRI